MPKVSRLELDQIYNQESEDYSPPLEELENEQKIEQQINEELFYIERELAQPTKDPYSGLENKFSVVDPDYYWDRLAYLRIDYEINKIKDLELREKIEERIQKVEQKVYKQFVPYIDSMVNRYGWQNSPLEKPPRTNFCKDEISILFEQARSIMSQFKVSDEERIGFLSDLERIEEKFHNYQKEPTLFTYERIEEEIYKMIRKIEDFDYYIGPKEKLKASLGNTSAKEKDLLKYEKLQARAHFLKEIASRMLNGKIRDGCQERAEHLYRHAIFLREKYTAPEDMFIIEANLRDLLGRIRNQKEVREEEIKKIDFDISEIKKRRLDYDFGQFVKKLERLLMKTKRLFAGESIDEDDDLFAESGANIDWPWLLLGVDRDSSVEDIKKAYWKKALKYHPDRGGDEEKMKKISEAYGLIKRVNSSL